MRSYCGTTVVVSKGSVDIRGSWLANSVCCILHGAVLSFVGNKIVNLAGGPAEDHWFNNQQDKECAVLQHNAGYCWDCMCFHLLD